MSLHTVGVFALRVRYQRRQMDNDVSLVRLDELLVRSLPQIAASLPRATKSETVTISGDGAGNDGVLAVAGLVKGLRALLQKPE